MSSLECFHISRNRLQFIPSDIGNLTNLFSLRLFHNPLVMVPKELLKISKANIILPTLKKLKLNATDEIDEVLQVYEDLDQL